MTSDEIVSFQTPGFLLGEHHKQSLNGNGDKEEKCTGK
jgi:hypothetical protein